MEVYRKKYLKMDFEIFIGIKWAHTKHSHKVSFCFVFIAAAPAKSLCFPSIFFYSHSIASFRAHGDTHLNEI